MLVLFLDFDGVLNSVKGWERDKPETGNYFTPECCEQLLRIIQEVPDLKIVISSSWRVLHPMAELKWFLKQIGVPEEMVIDKTASEHMPRGEQIDKWLKENADKSVEKFVIVDDDSFDMDPLKEYLVKTDGGLGLTHEKAEEIIKRFQGQKETKPD